MPKIIFAFVLLSSGACILAQDLDSEIRNKAQGMASALINWGPKMNTPGLSMWLEETGHGKAKGLSYIQYEIHTSGMPQNQVYTLLSWGIAEAGPKPTLEGVTLNKTGTAICAGRPDTCGDQAKPEDRIQLVVLAARGEPKRFSLVSEDGKEKVFTSVVPYPNIGEDRGCSLSLILGLPDAELVVLRGINFAPNAQVGIAYSSSGEQKTIPAKTSAEGSFDQGMLPFVKGKSAGTATIRANATNCSPTLTFEWGKGTYHLR